MNDRDEWLMFQARNGDASSMEYLVRRYADGILTFITRVVGTTHREEEIFQDVFLAVWAKRSTYRFPMPFRPWLYRIALNKCREVLRGRKILSVGHWEDWWEEGMPQQAAPHSPPGPVEQAIATETSELVAAAVAQLPTRQRAAVIMRIWNGLSYEEIAAALGSSEATLRSNMHYALDAIRRHLEPRLR